MTWLAEVHVGRLTADHESTYVVTWRLHPKSTPLRIGRRSYKTAKAAEGRAYGFARSYATAYDRPVLVSGPSGAFVVSVGTYPQEVDR